LIGIVSAAEWRICDSGAVRRMNLFGRGRMHQIRGRLFTIKDPERRRD
jgi:hypothetical protein